MTRPRTGPELQVLPRRSFGQRLRDTRLGAGLTQGEVSERFPGTKQQTIGKWERGEAVPSTEHHAELAVFIGLRSAEEVSSLVSDGVSGRPQGQGGGPRVNAGNRQKQVTDTRAALAKLVTAFAEKIGAGQELSAEELKILKTATDGLAR